MSIPSQWRNVAEIAQQIVGSKDLNFSSIQANFILQTALAEISRAHDNVYELTDEQIVNISREMLEPKIRETIIRTWATVMVCGTAHTDPFMNAYLCLTDVGPKNNHDGKRGTAMELKRQIEAEILPHATHLANTMRDTILRMANSYRLGGETYEITSVGGEKRKVTDVNEAELKLKHLSATDDISYTKI
jgi:hypothetical protein